MFKLNPTLEQRVHLNNAIDALTNLKQRAIALLPHIAEEVNSADKLRLHSKMLATPEVNRCNNIGLAHVLTLRIACQDAISVVKDVDAQTPIPKTKLVQQARTDKSRNNEVPVSTYDVSTETFTTTKPTPRYRRPIVLDGNLLKLDNWKDSPIQIVDYDCPQGSRETKAEVTRDSQGEFWVEFNYEKIPSNPTESNEQDSLRSILRNELL